MMADSLIEIIDNTTRENYNKIVIHKKMWIPVAEDLSFNTHPKLSNERQTYAEINQANKKLSRLLKIPGTEMYLSINPICIL